MNPYKVLGVSKYATKNDIKAVFNRLVKQYHPDNSSTADIKMLSDIIQAWDIIKNNHTDDAICRVTVKMSMKELAKNLGETLDIGVDNMLLSIKIPYTFRMGDTMKINSNADKLQIILTIEEEHG